MTFDTCDCLKDLLYLFYKKKKEIYYIKKKKELNALTQLHSLNFEVVVLIPTAIANRPFKVFIYLFLFYFILYFGCQYSI